MRVHTVILCLFDVAGIGRIVVNFLGSLVTVLFVVQIMEGETGLLFLVFSMKAVHGHQLSGIVHQPLFLQRKGKGGLVDKSRDIGRGNKVLVVGS